MSVKTSTYTLVHIHTYHPNVCINNYMYIHIDVYPYIASIITCTYIYRYIDRDIYMYHIYMPSIYKYIYIHNVYIYISTYTCLYIYFKPLFTRIYTHIDTYPYIPSKCPHIHISPATEKAAVNVLPASTLENKIGMDIPVLNVFLLSSF